jgi:hypothetical protein
MFLGDGGKVINGGAFYLASSIRGGGYGVLSNGLATVTNYATIKGVTRDGGAVRGRGAGDRQRIHAGAVGRLSPHRLRLTGASVAGAEIGVRAFSNHADPTAPNRAEARTKRASDAARRYGAP